MQILSIMWKTENRPLGEHQLYRHYARGCSSNVIDTPHLDNKDVRQNLP